MLSLRKYIKTRTLKANVFQRRINRFKLYYFNGYTKKTKLIKYKL